MAAEKAYAPDLPETTIHHIQSFLTGKEAAQTTLLSDSWRGAWSTRPAIVLAEADFPTRYRYSSYNALMLYFAKKTFRRYEESNLSIDTLVLSLETKWYIRSSRAVKWISKALKLGATDLTLALDPGAGMADVPVVDAVFGSERVVRLYLLGLTIEHELNVVKCSGLKSLTLKSLRISGDSFFNVLSCCPLIETLSLTYISASGVGPAPPTITLLKLRSLVLFRVSSELVSEMKTLFLDDLSSKLPNLLNLSLSLCVGAGEMIRNISSASLETLSLRNTYMYPSTTELQFHVPSIREFTFEGDDEFPNLSFRSKPRHHWVSRVLVMKKHGHLSALWFCKLRKFLAKMRGSKIHLSCLYVSPPYYACQEYKAEEIKGKVLEVETVTMDTEGRPCPDFDFLLDGLFRICSPNMVVVSPPNIVSLRRALERGMAAKSSLLARSQPMYGLRNLEEVNAQELIGNVWRSQPLDTISLDDSTCNEKRRYRFQLKWKRNDVVA